MTRRRPPTAQNKAVAKELMREIPKVELSEFRDAVGPLEELAADPATVTAEAALEALATLRAHRAVLDARLWHLLGAAVLEGTPARDVARVAEVPARTVSRRLAGTPAAWCGRPLAADPRRPYGWRAE